MIVDLAASAAPGKIRADICIIGSGAAGLTLAAELLDAREHVIVLESGRKDPDELDSRLNAVEFAGLRHDGALEGRVRAFGGTTRAWGGQLMPLCDSEIERRPWIPNSGWPLRLESLQPFYRRAEALLAVEGPPYDAQVWERLKIKPPEIDAERFSFRFSQWAPLTRRNFAVLLRRRLAASRNVTVLLDATATAIHCDPLGLHVSRVDARSRVGREVSIEARSFVVACGAIETARLLLASPSPDGRGVGNASGLVGRFFQDHISYIAAEIRPRTRTELQKVFDPRYLGRTMFTPKIEATQQLQRERGWLNVMGHLAFEIPSALGLLEVKRLLTSFQAGRISLPSWDEFAAMARGGSELARMMLARVVQKRRASPTRGAVRLLVDAEQAPNPESRITLNGALDELGMRKAVLNWRVTELETRTLQEFAQLLASELERLRLGKVVLAGPPDFSRRNELAAARDTFHHMGTARMSDSPEEGVTNTDSRCHGVDNLYVAGAALFPCGGISNPTFTAIALAIRLADHLKRLHSLTPRTL